MSPRLPAAALRRLESLLAAVAPSGFETPAARLWREMAAEFADGVSADAAGNSIAVVNPNGSPTIMLAGHIDEIGLIVTHIDEDGFLSFKEIGGWDPAVLVGQRVTIATDDGEVTGLIGRRATHLMTFEEQEGAIKAKDLWIDIGADDGDEAAAMVAIGDGGVLDVAPVRLPNDRIASRALDNRVGAFVVLEALRRYAQTPGSARVVAVANTQEEILQAGAAMVARQLEPEAAIVVDLTFASDHPDIDEGPIGERTIGSGPVFARGSMTSPVLFRRVRDAADELGIDYTIEAVAGKSGTDADAVAALGGVATGCASVPSRYMHTPNEMVSTRDVEALIRVLTEVARGLEPAIDWVP